MGYWSDTKMRKLLLLIIILLLVSGNARAADIYVKGFVDGGAHVVYYDTGASSCDDVTTGDTGPTDIQTACGQVAPPDKVYVCAHSEGHAYSGTDLDGADHLDLATEIVEGVGGTVVFDGSGFSDNIITLTPSGDITVKNLTLQNAYSGKRAILFNNASGSSKTFTLEDLTFDSNTSQNLAGGTGSAIRSNIADPVVLNITNCTFSGNEARLKGAAIYVTGAVTMTIDGSTFTSNAIESGQTGAGGALCIEDCTGLTTITDSTFTTNKAGGSGGAIMCYDSSLYVSDSTFTSNEGNYEQNSVWAGGGAILFDDTIDDASAYTLTVIDSTFTSNTLNVDAALTKGAGGAIDLSGHDATDVITATCTGNTYSGNHANTGGAVHISVYTNTTHTREKFYGNLAYLSGGAVTRGGANADCEGLISTFNFCLFDSNEAGVQSDGTPVAGSNSQGGAAMIRCYPKAIFNNCTFYGNESKGAGTPVGDSIYHSDEGNGFDGAGGATDHDRRSQIINCIFKATGSLSEIDDTGTGVGSDETAFEKIEYSCAETGENSGTSLSTTGFVTADPLMTDPANDDFTLASGSPAINNGTPNGSTPYSAATTDLSGNTITDSSGDSTSEYGDRIDMGAYEIADYRFSGRHYNMGIGGIGISPNLFNNRHEI
jgi:predicted outer membrane repeat protein